MILWTVCVRHGMPRLALDSIDNLAGSQSRKRLLRGHGPRYPKPGAGHNQGATGQIAVLAC